MIAHNAYTMSLFVGFVTKRISINYHLIHIDDIMEKEDQRHLIWYITEMMMRYEILLLLNDNFNEMYFPWKNGTLHNAHTYIESINLLDMI